MTPYLYPILLILVGFVALVAGGEFLVRGAAAIAAAAKISPLVIGLTVVAFGTSAPELAVSVQAAFSNKTDLAIGNAVGSNIFNILFVLGLAAFLAPPLLVSPRLIRVDLVLMIGASLFLLLVGSDGLIGRADGGLMFALLLGYIVWSIVSSRRSHQPSEEDSGAKPENLWLRIGTLLVGLVMLTLGSQWLVDGCSTIATLWGVSELVIGLTVVAVGTSLPEVVTSVVAAYRGERDIAVGNVVGSNLFNILCVLGLGSILSPSGIPVSAGALQCDIPVMIGVAVVCLPIFYVGNCISRAEGLLLITYYVAYTTYLVMDAIHHPATASVGQFLSMVFAPISALALLLNAARHWRNTLGRDGTLRASATK